MALAAAILASGDGGVAIEARPHTVELFFQITASGNYATGGDTLDIEAITGAPGLAMPPNTRQLPMQVTVTGAAGYIYQFVQGTDNANAKLKVLQSAGSAAPLAEIAASAYPAGVTGDTIIARASFLRG